MTTNCQLWLRGIRYGDTYMTGTRQDQLCLIAANDWAVEGHHIRWLSAELSIYGFMFVTGRHADIIMRTTERSEHPIV